MTALQAPRSREAYDDDASALEGIHARDAEALRTLIRRHAGTLGAIRRDHGQDVQQEVLVRLWAKPPAAWSLSASGWMRVVARNVAIDGARREGRAELVALDPEVDLSYDPEQLTLASLEVEEILRAVRPDDAALLTEHYLRGVPLEMMARRSGISVDAMKMRMSRVRSRTRTAASKIGYSGLAPTWQRVRGWVQSVPAEMASGAVAAGLAVGLAIGGATPPSQPDVVPLTPTITGMPGAEQLEAQAALEQTARVILPAPAAPLESPTTGEAAGAPAGQPPGPSGPEAPEADREVFAQVQNPVTGGRTGVADHAPEPHQFSVDVLPGDPAARGADAGGFEPPAYEVLETACQVVNEAPDQVATCTQH